MVHFTDTVTGSLIVLDWETAPAGAGPVVASPHRATA